jgi:hypothetical protein
MMKNIKQRMLNAIAAHTRLVTLGITLAVTTTITLAAGVTVIDHLHSSFA